MRRGLMAWDADEVPIAALHERTRRLQAAMAEANQDALILYTNFIRSAAVSYLTAFSPYWADGVLLVPREGEPVFATTLSKRVGEWIQTVKPVGELATSPNPGTIIGQRVAAGNLRSVAILELDAFPSGLCSEIAAAAPGIEIVDGSKIFAAARIIDAVERRLLERADHIASEALARMNAESAGTAGDAVGAVEKSARMDGAEEVYIALACDLDADLRFARVSGARPLGARFAIRATVAYKGVWVRRIQTYARDEKDRVAIGRADDWFRSRLRDRDAPFPAGAKLINLTAEGPLGTRPLAVIAANERDAAALAPVITASLDIDGVPWCGAGLAQRPA